MQKVGYFCHILPMTRHVMPPLSRVKTASVATMAVIVGHIGVPPSPRSVSLICQERAIRVVAVTEMASTMTLTASMSLK